MHAALQNRKKSAYRIAYLTGQGVEGSFDWAGDPVLLGRDNAQLVIPDPTVSSRHATLRVRATVVEIRDENSTAGVFLDGLRLPCDWTPCPLAKTLWLGDCQLRVVAIDASDAQTVLIARDVEAELQPHDWASSVLSHAPSSPPEATPVVATSTAARAKEHRSDDAGRNADSSALLRPADNARAPVASPAPSPSGSSSRVAPVSDPQQPQPTPPSPGDGRRSEPQPVAASTRAGRSRSRYANARLFLGLLSLFAIACLWYLLLFPPSLQHAQ